MDISQYSLAQLQELQKIIPAEIVRRKNQEKQEALSKLNQLADSLGFSLDELLEKTKAGKKEKAERKPVAVKYRHPQQSDLTWTGRGRQPGWVVAWLGSGGNLQDLHV